MYRSPKNYMKNTNKYNSHWKVTSRTLQEIYEEIPTINPTLNKT